ncbi:polyphosphate--glucose phosphotransferase [Lutimonas zeaxanthinifaciens]|uniref:polyphosphate--glucose phosphotransferase n=1 Tax=Lutimonas zeaxanthinifaciens TaxID=3060215 RepID=UPI00265D2F33|nr:ROK family protein [Lutimonas sp. YSD2104]WKK66987.1 ROK family protein [Lutimonas sp. YSD2104]
MQILGIDIGGTGIKGAIVDTTTGDLLTEKFRLPTPRPALPAEVAKVVHQIVDHFNWRGEVGAGFPTPLSHGKCLSGGNLHPDWKGVQADELFKSVTGLEFTVINDADAAAEAEMHFGAGKGKDGLVAVITLGTGIGSGLFFNGALIPNSELGHVTFKGAPFEKYAADSIRKKEDLSYTKWGKRLNKYFKHIELILSPDLFIIGGGASKKIDRFKDEIKIRTRIIPAENKNEAGIIGAAVGAFDEVK